MRLQESQLKMIWSVLEFSCFRATMPEASFLASVLTRLTQIIKENCNQYKPSRDFVFVS